MASACEMTVPRDCQLDGVTSAINPPTNKAPKIAAPRISREPVNFMPFSLLGPIVVVSKGGAYALLTSSWGLCPLSLFFP